jgi:hypothetical protein
MLDFDDTADKLMYSVFVEWSLSRNPLKQRQDNIATAKQTGVNIQSLLPLQPTWLASFYVLIRIQRLTAWAHSSG